jgi:hypothetical protein
MGCRPVAVVIMRIHKYEIIFKIQCLLYVPPGAAINNYFCAELTEISLVFLTINRSFDKE